MKRLNPKTNQLFKTGEVREDGKIFVKYQNRFLTNGFRVEEWASPKVFENRKNYLKKYQINYHNLKKTSCDYRARHLIDSARQRGKITITRDWVSEKLKLGVCELTGLPFDFENSKDHRCNPYSPSLDRIDPKNKEYSPENTRVILHALNLALNEYGLDTLKHIVSHLK